MRPWRHPHRVSGVPLQTPLAPGARTGRRVYDAYARIFDVHTHGWMNVHAAHLNLPLGRGTEAIAMHNASALIIPYLPALAASSPIFDPGRTIVSSHTEGICLISSTASWSNKRCGCSAKIKSGD